MTPHPSPRSPSARHRPLLIVAAVWWLVFVGLALTAARAGVSTLDHVAHALVGIASHAVLEGFMAAASHLGTAPVLAPLTLAATLLLWPGHRRWALALPPLMAGAGVLQWAAKWAVDRPRPDLAPGGFPSGHVLGLMVFFGLLAYLVWCARRGRRGRGVAAGACFVPVLVVAWSRLYLGVHWFTDVIGGFAAGAGYLVLAIVAIERLTDARPGRLRGVLHGAAADTS